jgi:predicted kinase
VLTIVTGPPCGGKSTHIRQHATPNAIIIDLDRIALALSTEGCDHHQYPPHVRNTALAARRAAIRTALDYTHHTDVWIIDTKPTRESWATYKAHGAQTHKADPGVDVCLARAQRERPPWVQQVIHDYYTP